MKFRFQTILASALIASSTVSYASSFLDNVAKTLPAGISNQSDGYLSATWDGLKKIFHDGNNSLIVPMYTIHPAWDYPNRRQENGFTWGGGISRSYLDDQGNRRLVYAMAFSDSHNNFEPFVGYAWLGRWKLGSLGSLPLYGEAGYTLGVTMRGDYSWLPIPAPLPLLGVGTENTMFYGTYVPFSNIFFFFTNITVDDAKTRSLPLASSSPFANKNVIYAGGGWQKTDMNGTDAVTITSDSAYTLGYRRFINRHWAIDFNYTRSSHDVKYHDKKFGKYDLTGYILTGQYHFEASDNWRLYAGLGGGYWRLNNLQMDPGWSTKKSAISYVIQAGATYAISKNLQVSGNWEMSFPRFRSHHENSSFSMRPSPSTFKLTLGWAF